MYVSNFRNLLIMRRLFGRFFFFLFNYWAVRWREQRNDRKIADLADIKRIKGIPKGRRFLFQLQNYRYFVQWLILI